jgi:NAD(P)-dependent dehydrogenase (short-subunit alcohol dehydrogenase family)
VDELSGRTAFVTGGARGIGLAIARSLANRGVAVAIVDVDETSLLSALDDLSARTRAHAVTLDVTDQHAFLAAADEAERILGRVTVLINNAGILDSVSPSRMSRAMWQHVMGINLGGVYNGLETFVPRMIRRGGGAHIVNTASAAGLVESGSGFLYHASKFAVVGLSESLRAELAHHDIGVTVLCPGAVATGIVENADRLRPETAPHHSARVAEILSSAHHRLQEQGTPAAAVGEMVVEAILANRPYLMTDDRCVEAIRARADALIRSTPQAIAAGQAPPPPSLSR